MSNVRSYTAKQLLDRVASHAQGFIDFPDNKWNIFVRSNEDAYNRFDDKHYLFDGTKFLSVYSCTTNTGGKGLKSYDSYNDLGAAILQSDRIVYHGHERGISKGRMVFRQREIWPYYRDGDKDNFAEEIGELYWDIIHAHIHDVKMGNVDEFKEFINGWSLACLVLNNGAQWNDFFEVQTKGQEYITSCILKEFEV